MHEKILMKMTRYSEPQILVILRQAEGGCLSLRHYLVLSGLFNVIIILSYISTHNTTHNETSDQNRVNQGLLYPTARVEIEANESGTPDHGPRVSGHGPLVLG